MTWVADEVFAFTAPLANGGEVTHDVHVAGSGPPILILQELPGIGPETLDLAERLNAAGFRTYLPHMFGTWGKLTMTRNVLRFFCIRREFNIFLKGGQSPIATWMRALAREIRDRESAPGVGVLGMCMTGSFALTLMADDAVIGGVASQPALPAGSRGQLHMSEADVVAACAGMAKNGPGLAMRFRDDKLVPDELFGALRRAFGEHLDTVEFSGDRHAMLTVHFHQPAYDRMEAYFRERFAHFTAHP